MATFTYALDTPAPDRCRGAVLTIGNFDGVHLGHQSLLAEAGKQARQHACASVAVTLDPPPVQILRPAQSGPLLTTLADRMALLQSHGVDHVLVLHTTAALLQRSARDFFEQ